MIRCGLVLVLPVVETAAFAALMPWLRVTARAAVLSGEEIARMYSFQVCEIVKSVFASGCLLACLRWRRNHQETRRSQRE